MEKQSAGKRWKVKVCALIQRLTFHNCFASRLAAGVLYHLPLRGYDRNGCLRELIHSYEPSCTNEKTVRKRIRDLMYARAYYAIEYKEYYLFGIDKGETPDKRDYVGWWELESYFALLDTLGRREVFDRKEKTYELFKDFYHRELICLSLEESKQMFLDFLERYPSCILKPTNNLGGHGIEFLHASDRQSAERLWERLREHRPFILEELIEQAPEMSVFYPHAVNTIRYNTFYHGERLTRMQAAFRMGRGGSRVDNATNGGIYTLVDTETGRILCPAKSDWNETFERHPDTGILFEGSVIPRWDELNVLVEQVVRVVPEQKQVGWDFALSRDGWVMVEGNTMPAIQSFDLDHGLRGLITDTFGKVIPMWK